MSGWKVRDVISKLRFPILEETPTIIHEEIGTQIFNIYKTIDTGLDISKRFQSLLGCLMLLSRLDLFNVFGWLVFNSLF